MPFDAVMFDLDGTLLDTLEDISNTLNTVLELNGYPTHSLDECRILVGFGMRELVRSALPENLQHDEALADKLLKEMHRPFSWSMKLQINTSKATHNYCEGYRRLNNLSSIMQKW